jgi:hypothetical protein
MYARTVPTYFTLRTLLYFTLVHIIRVRKDRPRVLGLKRVLFYVKLFKRFLMGGGKCNE